MRLRQVLYRAYKKGAFPFPSTISGVVPRKDDTFIVSYPRSGNTWMRLWIANALTSEPIGLRLLNDYVPGIYTQKEKIPLLPSPRFIKTHDCFPYCYPKTIYVYRDYRDVLVSYYTYATTTGQFRGSWSEFIRAPFLRQSFGAWKDHLSEAFAFAQSHPSKICMIGYEEMLSSPMICLEKVLSFCEISPQKPLEAIVEHTHFISLQQQEKRNGSLLADRGGSAFVFGEKEHWRQRFSPEDIEEVVYRQKNADWLVRLGYAI